MRESDFQRSLIRELKQMFPGCVVLKNDPGYLQGIPDLLLLWKEHWAALEVKRSRSASRQPNQTYWVEKMDGMSFARFVCPENKEEVYHEIQQAFGL